MADLRRADVGPAGAGLEVAVAELVDGLDEQAVGAADRRVGDAVAPGYRSPAPGSGPPERGRPTGIAAQLDDDIPF